MIKAVGGYFGLEMSRAESLRYPDAQYFQSARACFYALLIQGKPSKVWLPYYNCDAMLGPLQRMGIDYGFYAIDEDFTISRALRLAPTEWLVYVNYFGLCDRQQAEVLRRFNPAQVVLDHAQAYYSPPVDCLATLYSPRKFFGVPDGGILVSNVRVGSTAADEEASHQRMSHLLKRFATSAEAGYADFQAAEKSLEAFDVSEMSQLSRNLLACADTPTVIEQRNHNFLTLHARLAEHNALAFDPSTLNGPLCYPFLNERNDAVRPDLLGESVYVARYWAECQGRCSPASWEYKLSRLLLPLPCDHRYTDADVQRVITLIEKGLKGD
ncbi:hypothetical protein HU734_007730 [Pseudomonas wayambapalatensis]|nr:hypothetical protein HU734_007730 [Pseudomonas wayambapalatensis]